jgi:DNA processing protein
VISILETEYGSVENAFEMVHKGEITKGLYEKKRLAEILRDPDRIEAARKIYNNAVKKGMRIITRASKLYPEFLREISSSPAVLYCYGKLPYEIEIEKGENMPLLALVGARNCSAYGYGTALKFSRILSALGLGIVSGMARGIDSAAHRGAIDSESYTVEVLGSGADVIYPMENKHLYDRIKQTDQ